MRKINKQDLCNKKIVDINNDSVNLLTLFFADGTSIDIWAESAVFLGGMSIPGFFVDGDEEDE